VNSAQVFVNEPQFCEGVELSFEIEYARDTPRLMGDGKESCGLRCGIANKAMKLPVVNEWVQWNIVCIQRETGVTNGQSIARICHAVVNDRIQLERFVCFGIEI
jgi:hypothetical protein